MMSRWFDRPTRASLLAFLAWWFVWVAFVADVAITTIFVAAESSHLALAAVIFWSSLASLLVILWVLSHQFEAPASVLQPGFARGEWKAVLTLLAGWAGFHGIALLMARCDWSAAAVWAGLPIAATAVGSLGRAPLYPGYRSGWAIFLTIMLFPIGGLFWWFAPEVDRMLAGYRPGFLCVLLGCELAGLFVHRQFFERLHRRLAEHSDGAPPWSASDATAMARWWSMQRPGLQSLRINAADPSMATLTAQRAALEPSFGRRSQVRRLAAAVNCPADDPRRQLLLWRAMPPFAAWEIATFLGISTIVGYCVVGLVANLVSPSSPYRDSAQFYSFLAAGVMIIMCGAPIAILILLRPFLARHLLMTLNRRDWVRMVFRDTAINFVPAIVAAAIGVIIYAWFAPSRFWSAPQVALTVAAGLACVYSNSLLVLSSSKLWKLMTTAAWETFVFTLCLGPLPLLLLILDSTGILPGALEFAIWPSAWWVPMFVNAAIIYQFARDHWLKCEFD